MALPSSSAEVTVPSSAPARCGHDAGPFGAYLRRVAPQINERIALHLASFGQIGGVEPDVGTMLLGGKRLRGAFAMLAFDILSTDTGMREVALDLASAVEVAHSASLILDDILDGDESRRGSPALHVTNGEKRALLKMVGVVSLPYAIASRRGTAYVGLLAETHRRMVNGVLSEASPPVIPPRKLYERIITLKTGELFGLAARFGGMAAGADPGIVEDLARYGLWTGKAMQIADDTVDLRRALTGRTKVLVGSEMILLRCLLRPEGGHSDEGMFESSLRSLQDGDITDAGRGHLEVRLKNRLEEEIEAAASMAMALREKMRSSGSMVPSLGDGPDPLSAAPGEIARMTLGQ
jgi:geranylgeranyl diphosphate synthase type II